MDDGFLLNRSPIKIEEPLKIGFVVKMSEMAFVKEAGGNSRKRMKTYVEDNFLPPTKSEAISYVYSRNRIFSGSLKLKVYGFQI